MNSANIIYWEKQSSDRMCALHSINSLLQGPIFSDFDLSKIASSIDDEERRLLSPEDRKNYESQHSSSDGYFSWTVMERGLKQKGFNAISIKHEDRRDALQNPNKEEGFIVHQGDHWYALRRIGDIWYDLNSLRPSASIVDDLPSLITSLTMSGFTVFVVRGPFSRSERPKMLNKTNQYYLTHQDMQRMNQEATAKKAGSSSSLAQRNSSNSAGEYQWPVSRGNTCSPILGSSTAPPNGVSASTNSNGNATPQVLTQEEIELQEAIRLSMESFAQENAPEEPKPEPVGTEGVYVIQIRSHLCTIRRKFQVDSATVKDLFGWIEWHCFKNNIKQNNVHLNVLDVKLTMNFGPELTRRASGRYLNGDLDVSPLDTLRSVGISDNSSFMMSF